VLRAPSSTVLKQNFSGLHRVFHTFLGVPGSASEKLYLKPFAEFFAWASMPTAEGNKN